MPVRETVAEIKIHYPELILALDRSSQYIYEFPFLIYIGRYQARNKTRWMVKTNPERNPMRG